MKEIILSSGDVCLFDDEDYAWINQWKWNCVKSLNTSYAIRSIWLKNERRYTSIRMHRLITDAPHGMDVDHIDRDGLNNCRSNLRICTRTQNNANSPAHCDNQTSDYKGVSRIERDGHYYWMARIRKDGKQKYLGISKNEEAAAKMYDSAAVEMFGEYASPNFPAPATHEATC